MCYFAKGYGKEIQNFLRMSFIPIDQKRLLGVVINCRLLYFSMVIYPPPMSLTPKVPFI